MTRFNTQLVHGLPVNDNNTGAVNPPIYNSTTYAFEKVDAMPRYDYARSGNPTRDFLEQQIAQLEQGTRGFAFASGLAAIHAVLVQWLEGKAPLTNCYVAAARPGGNPRARQLLAQAFDVVDAPWRGIGVIAQSGYALKPALAAHDARRQLPLVTPAQPGKDLPAGCDCARVVLGKISPPACRLYGTACRPASPIGPCMVSDEGACRIWWSAGLHRRTPPDRASGAANVGGPS